MLTVSKLYVGRPGGNPRDTLINIFIHTYARAIFGVQNFEFQYLEGGVQKNEYFWGYGDFVDTFRVITKLNFIFRGHFYAFYYLFLRPKVQQNGGYF